MTVTINTLDGRSHVTQCDEGDLVKILTGISEKEPYLLINRDKTIPTYIVTSTISSVTSSK